MTLVAPPSARLTQATRAWRELGIVVLAMVGYFGLRLVVEGDRATAVQNADRLLRWEASWGIDVERDVQAWVLDHAVILELSSAAYVWLHWPLLIVAMVFLAFLAPDVLARLRNALIVSGAIGVVLFALVPMAPPRFMPGFVGTVSDAARRHYLPYPLGWTNQVAAFPSYHVGWTLIACLAVAGVLRTRWARFAVIVPALVMAVAVVGTGNHYVLDSLAGAVFALGAWWATGRWATGRWGSGRWGSGRRSVGDRHDGDRTGIAVGADDHRHLVHVPPSADAVARRHRPAPLRRHRRPSAILHR